MVVELVEPKLRPCWRYGYNAHLEARIQDGMLILWYACRECGPLGDCQEVAVIWGDGNLQEAINIAADYWNKEQVSKKAELDKRIAARYNTYE